MRTEHWPDYVQPAVFAYNTSIQDTLQEVPFRLVYGREPVLPGDVLLSHTGEHFRSQEDYVNVLQDRISFAYTFVRQQLEDRRNTYLAANKNLKSIPIYQPGDKVWVLIPVKTIKGTVGKFTHPYVGPYQVIKKMSEVNYQVKPVPPLKGSITIMHVMRLKPFNQPLEENVDEPVNRPTLADMAYRQAPGIRRIKAKEAVVNPSPSVSAVNPVPVSSTEPTCTSTSNVNPGTPPILRTTRSRTAGKSQTYTGQA
jgi:hypothetical protein